MESESGKIVLKRKDFRGRPIWVLPPEWLPVRAGMTFLGERSRAAVAALVDTLSGEYPGSVILIGSGSKKDWLTARPDGLASVGSTRPLAWGGNSVEPLPMASVYTPDGFAALLAKIAPKHLQREELEAMEGVVVVEEGPDGLAQSSLGSRWRAVHAADPWLRELLASPDAGALDDGEESLPEGMGL
jgi:hypothetical protein